MTQDANAVATHHELARQIQFLNAVNEILRAKLPKFIAPLFLKLLLLKSDATPESHWNLLLVENAVHSYLQQTCLLAQPLHAYRPVAAKLLI